jgi:cytochrome bd-type quinol oxidase subunit 2
MLFDGTPTRWLAIIWHYLVLLFVIAGGLWALIELPSTISLRYRQVRNKLALRSQSSAGKRLKKLESELVELGQVPVIEQYQVKFYVLVLAAFSTSTIGLAAWAFSIFIVYKDYPSMWMGLAFTMLLFSSVISAAGMSHFQPLMEAVRGMRRRELEAGITAMKNKLAKFGEAQR